MENKIACYSFLPWVRRGLSQEINEVDNLGVTSSGQTNRASITVDIKVTAEEITDSPAPPLIPKAIQLYGPGDITGINPDSIIRTEPKEGVTNFEPNFMPYIEFYDEGFPWQYTPADANGNRLRPWLALFVLKEEQEFSLDEFNPRLTPLPSISISGDPEDSQLFPPQDQYWAWAHAHLNEFIDNTAGNGLSEKLRNIIDEDPNTGCARILCPRKLLPNTRYHAFLVPAYEKGRLAGLGASKEQINAALTQQYSWGFEQTILPKRFPYYHTWSFRTGSKGDFEYLVRALKPRLLDNRVGRRPMDISDPGYGLEFDGQVQDIKGGVYLEGALRIPGNDATTLLNLSSHSGTNANKAINFVSEMEDLLNLEQQLRKGGVPASSNFKQNPFFTDTSTIEDDPIITPPIYGKWHALESRVNKQQKQRWLNQLNLDPANRTVAGLGGKVIRKGQEEYMDRAWDQFGDILTANRKLLQTQLSEQLSRNLFRKRIKHLRDSELISLTSQMQTRIILNSKTLAYQLKQSDLPASIVSTSFTKVTRTAGPVDRFRTGSNDLEFDAINKTAQKKITVSPSYNKFSSNADISLSQLDSFVSKTVVKKRGSGSIRSIGIKAKPLTRFRTSTVQPKLSGSTRIRDLVNSKDILNKIIPDSGFSVSNVTPLDSIPQRAKGLENAFKPYENYFSGKHWQLQQKKNPINLRAIRSDLLKALSPEKIFKKRVLKRLVLGKDIRISPPEKIEPILVAPKFPDAMYKPLVNISSELLIPNLNLIQNNTISLLESNQDFIESYMVGINHEFSRELLWREFLTDQRGSYFRQFWDAYKKEDEDDVSNEQPESTKDITEIHTWRKSTPLGTHRPTSNAFFNHKRKSSVTGEQEDKLVVVIRGDLLKKYPNTIVFMQQAKWEGTPSNPKKTEPRVLGAEETIIYPIFEAKVEPDIYFIGFDITASEAKGNDKVNNAPGYFVGLKERTGELHFGMDVADSDPKPSTVLGGILNHYVIPLKAARTSTSLAKITTDEESTSWNDLTWNDMPSDVVAKGGYVNLNDAPQNPLRDGINWNIGAGTHAADMAFILYQNPYMVAIHADDMLPENV